VDPIPFQRVIVLGFDGADPELLARYMAAGELPAIKALADRGSFLPLQTTTPAQSPVSWPSILTGLNPGKTGVFGFLSLKEDGPALEYALTRWEEDPLPDTADRLFMVAGLGIIVGLIVWVLARMVRLRGKAAALGGLVSGGALAAACAYFLFTLVPESLPTPVPVREGIPFYEILARNGRRSVVLEGPMDFPPPETEGLRMLCGLGVPDIAGSDASWAVFTSEILPVSRTTTGGRVVLLESLEGVNEVEIPGPADPFVQDALRRLRTRGVQTYEEDEEYRRLEQRRFTRIKMHIGWKPGEARVRLELPDLEPVVLEKGDWTPFLPLTFRVNSLIAYRGLVRFYLDRADSELRLYQEPVGWDPSHPNRKVPLSSPPDYVKVLARKENAGPFETAGWACATNALRDRMIDEKTFIQDVMDGMQRREAMLRMELEKKDWQCLFAVFTGVDRLQHMLWRHLDEDHPAHRSEEAGAGQAALLGMYKALDRIVDRVTRYYLEEDTALVVLSDHGFTSFRWGVNLNTWLKKQGYLAVKSGGVRPPSMGEPFPAVDWSRTRAFAFGLGQIRINVKRGKRESRGIVAPEAYAALVREIADKLMQLKHEGKTVVHRVDVRDRAYSGPHLHRAPDILPGFVRGYRVSGATVYGGVPPRIFEPNESNWSGDHCSVSPDLVPGILVTSLKLGATRASGVDIAPTILSLLGVKYSGGFDGKALSLKP